MVICIDSCVFIRGMIRGDEDTEQLFGLIGPDVQLVIPRLVAVEVTRNLTERPQQKVFFGLFHKNENALIIDGPIPPRIIAHYMSLGLSEKGDALIGAFADWMRVDFLISDNRHFLNELHTDAYRLVTPAAFLEAIATL